MRAFSKKNPKIISLLAEADPDEHMLTFRRQLDTHKSNKSKIRIMKDIKEVHYLVIVRSCRILSQPLILKSMNITYFNGVFI